MGIRDPLTEARWRDPLTEARKRDPLTEARSVTLLRRRAEDMTLLRGHVKSRPSYGGASVTLLRRHTIAILSRRRVGLEREANARTPPFVVTVRSVLCPLSLRAPQCARHKFRRRSRKGIVRCAASPFRGRRRRQTRLSGRVKCARLAMPATSFVSSSKTSLTWDRSGTVFA